MSFAGIARKLASSGYAVFAMDYPGFGLSEGLHGYIRSFNRLVDDVIEHYSKVKGILANFLHSCVTFFGRISAEMHQIKFECLVQLIAHLTMEEKNKKKL